MKNTKMKMNLKRKTSIRDFGFSRIRNAAHHEDITEWFSDHDVNLSDVINGYNISVE